MQSHVCNGWYSLAARSLWVPVFVCGVSTCRLNASLEPLLFLLITILVAIMLCSVSKWDMLGLAHARNECRQERNRLSRKEITINME